MKKENKELARKQRAEKRRKEEWMKKGKRAVMIGVPLILVLILIIWAAAASQESKGGDSGSVSDTEQTAADYEMQPLYNTDTSLVVQDKDTVNIDYIGDVDGIEFVGGNTNGNGASLTIGSGAYIDDFEEQLIGHSVGETVDVNVTFSENYGNEELNGKEAHFSVTINGIYE